MHRSYDYVLKNCSAVTHGQQIPEGYGEEALLMGIKLLEESHSFVAQDS